MQPEIPLNKVGGLSTRTWKIIGIICLIAAVFLLPFVSSDYRTFQFTLALIYAIAILGLNILTGYNGQFSLGHGAFYAIGAYTAAVMMEIWGVPYYLTPFAAAVVCLIAGFLFGLPALKLEGLYLALATFALAIALPQILKYDALEHWTGGVQGIVIIKPESPFGLPLSQDQWLYFFTLAFTGVLFWAGRNLLRSRTGRAIAAIRDNHTAAEALGINTSLIKSLTFGISASYTGIAGALGAIVIQFVAPDSFNLFVSISFLIGMVIGGLASIPGAVYGGIFLQFIPNVAEQISKAAPWAIYGIFLIICMYLMPTGIAGFIGLVRDWIMRKWSTSPSMPPDTHQVAGAPSREGKG